MYTGLEKYKPAESKSTRVLGRFPMRNKFVADHIYDTTGIRRTPKQVGSRIQQLRDTHSGKHSQSRLVSPPSPPLTMTLATQSSRRSRIVITR